MAQGDLWRVPGGREGIEVGRTRDYLRIACLNPQWPYPEPPREYVKDLCTKLPSRYLHGAVPCEDEEGA